MNGKVLAGIVVVALAAAAAAGYYYFATPKAVVLGDIKQYVFVQSTTKPEIAVIDVTKDELVTRLQLSLVPDDLLVAKEPKRVIYSNRASKTVHIYDIATQADEAVLTLPFSPDTLALSPDSLFLVATDSTTGQLGIINLDNNTIARVLEQTFTRPSAVAFSADSMQVHLTDSVKGQIVTVDLLSGYVLDPIQMSLALDPAQTPKGDEMSALTRTPNSLFGLVTQKAEGHVSVVNMRQWAEEYRLQVGKGASRAYVTADGVYMMVGNDLDRTVTVLSTEPWEVVATLPGVGGVTSISTGFFEQLAFIVSNTENKVAVIDLEKMETVAFLDLPGGPAEGIADVDGKKLYVPLHDSGGLAVIDIYNKTVHKIIENVTDAPWGVAMAATNNYCH
ncbi:MAG: hypothetical protein CVT82_15580 [Alphaproteobacteria bacterium HGW-Alphaproteobacteria-4]|nr:MAG: hypothetical protein CVT82_15580 [Alphaproteobacteria bacterium HGW-Alphaproteobacteria-4]